MRALPVDRHHLRARASKWPTPTIRVIRICKLSIIWQKLGVTAPCPGGALPLRPLWMSLRSAIQDSRFTFPSPSCSRCSLATSLRILSASRRCLARKASNETTRPRPPISGPSYKQPRPGHWPLSAQRGQAGIRTPHEYSLPWCTPRPFFE